MRSLWRATIISLMLMFAAGSILLPVDEVRAGTPITGDIIADAVWTPAGSPYWIETDVTVRLGVELVVLAGTEVRFNGYYSLNVVGRFLVEGNATDPVVFTHNSSTPSPADWYGLFVYGEAHMDYANISYADIGTYIGTSYTTINESFFYRNDWSVIVELTPSNLIRNNTFYNSTYCGITIWQSDSNTIKGNNASRNGDSGIWLYEANGNVVSNNTLHRNYWNGMRISGGSSSNVIEENTILESQLYQGIGVWDSSDNFILNNTIRRNNNNGVYLQQSSGNNISGNEISDSVNYHGISMYMADSNVMIGNHIYEVFQDGFYLESAFLNRIFENDIHDNDNGIYLYDTHLTDIAGNNITGNNMGIQTSLSSGTSILANNVSANPGIGFGVYLLDDSNDVEVIGNTIMENAWGGVVVAGSNFVIISDNQIANHPNEGIHIRHSTNITVTMNNLTFNGVCGMYLQNSSDVSIHHNNFIGHVDNAYDDGGSENRWDDGYPSGGNYWDDYTGTDYFSGPGQDQPGSDYIGDEPYVIDSDTQDNYPLAYRFGTSPSLPPANLDAHLNGDGFENVTLTWNLSGDDGAGRDDVVTYSIFRGTTYHPSGLGYGPIRNVTSGTSTFENVLVGEGDPNSYFYRVCAVNIQGVPSCATEQVAKFTGSLAKGPQIVSVPLIQSNESIENVLQTVDYDRAWTYDSDSQQWKSYMKDKTYKGDLAHVNHTMGLWINVTKDSNLSVAGVVPAQTTIHLYMGWNLVSFPSFNASYTVADLKAEVPVERVEAFDSSAPPHFLRVLLDSDVLLAGQGYWVKTSEDATWVLSNA